MSHSNKTCEWHFRCNAVIFFSNRQRFLIQKPGWDVNIPNLNWLAFINKGSYLCMHVKKNYQTSSSRTMAGALSKVRAMATRCFSPPLSFRPLSPTNVSYSTFQSAKREEGQFQMQTTLYVSVHHLLKFTGYELITDM